MRSGELCDRAIDKFAVGKRHRAVSSIARLSIVTSDRAIDNFRVGKRHRAVSRVALLSMLIFDRQFLTQHTIYSGSQKSEVCPMPYTQSYLIFLRNPIINYFLLGAIFSIEISASITDSTIGAATVPPEEPCLGSSITASTTYRGASTGIIPTKLVIIALLE